MERTMETSLTDFQEEYLVQRYYNVRNPESFSGSNKLWKLIKKDKVVTRPQMEKWLREQDLYTSYFPKRIKPKVPQTIAPKPDYSWQADTAYMTTFEEANDDFAYFVLVIDVFSRYVWTEPLKTLKGTEMKSALEKLFEQDKCERLYTDAGTEFVNRTVKSFLNANNVKHYISRSERKASMAERAIKGFKKVLFQYMEHNDTKQWKDVLPDVTHRYNNSVHRIIQMTPSQARTAEIYDVWTNQYQTKSRKKRIKKPKNLTPDFKFNVGDVVKISTARRPFQREYDQTFTTETFRIIERQKKGIISLYKIKDFLNEPVIGDFLDNELVRVFVPENKQYKIDKVIRNRTRKGKKEYLVSWKGWPKQFNSWVSDLQLL